MAMRPELRRGARGSSHPGETAAGRPARPAGFCPVPCLWSRAFRSLKPGRVHGEVRTQRRGHELRLFLRKNSLPQIEPKD